ncbi:hypothetical protein HYW36_00335 [Candidatus Saccharibacteria bacterium]|nr:hypothetical protein [Candidatus Saccharibacteria bacterium]
MKLALKTQAVSLRKKGKTYSEIRTAIDHVSKSTLSRWLKDVALTPEQEAQIKNKMITQGHAGRLKGVLRNKQKRIERLAKISTQAKKEYPKLIKNPRFMAGLILYLAEGNKKHERFGFMNSDRYLVEIMVRWVKDFGNIEVDDINYRLYIHDVYAHENCEQLWSDFLQLNSGQLFKTVYKQTPHKIKKNPLYKGCMRMEISGSELYWKVMTWQQCLYKSLKI